MQNFAINGGTLNGDPEVWFDDSFANVVVQTAGSVANGFVLSGAAPVSIGSSLSLAYMAKLSGQAGVSLSASGSLILGLSLVGAAQVKLKTTGDFLRWVMIQGVTPTVVGLSGDIAVVPAISATFALVLKADLDLHIAVGHKIEGVLPVVIDSTFQAYSVPATLLSGAAAVQLAGIGKGNLIVTSPPGAAAIELKSNGDARIGAKLSLEGSVEIGIYARGYLESWHYVYAEGSAMIDIMARAETHGIPIIPGYYIEAPAMRAMRVAEEARLFKVQAERRI
ncbi:hypothetical protein D3C87_1210400 [compost metagenome]